MRPRCASSRPPSSGFTLLEVMCAFAILAGITGFVTTVFVQNVRSGSVAHAQRELREAADTIWRKMIYQYWKYEDGKRDTLDREYGEFADLPDHRRDRWAKFRYEFNKKEQTVAGKAGDEEGESPFAAPDDEEETPPRGETGEAEEKEPVFVKLLHLTLKIYRKEDAPHADPLLVLSTWIDPDEIGESDR